MHAKAAYMRKHHAKQAALALIAAGDEATIRQLKKSRAKKSKWMLKARSRETAEAEKDDVKLRGKRCAALAKEAKRKQKDPRGDHEKKRRPTTGFRSLHVFGTSSASRGRQWSHNMLVIIMVGTMPYVRVPPNKHCIISAPEGGSSDGWTGSINARSRQA